MLILYDVRALIFEGLEYSPFFKKTAQNVEILEEIVEIIFIYFYAIGLGPNRESQYENTYLKSRDHRVNVSDVLCGLKVETMCKGESKFAVKPQNKIGQE